MLTPEQCAEIKARWAAATRVAVPSWVVERQPDACVVLDGTWHKIALLYESQTSEATAIASAPADIAALLATVEALRSELDEAVGLVRSLRDAMVTWGSLEDGVPDGQDSGEFNKIGEAFDAANAFLARRGGA